MKINTISVISDPFSSLLNAHNTTRHAATERQKDSTVIWSWEITFREQALNEIRTAKWEKQGIDNGQIIIYDHEVVVPRYSIKNILSRYMKLRRPPCHTRQKKWIYVSLRDGTGQNHTILWNIFAKNALGIHPMIWNK